MANFSKIDQSELALGQEEIVTLLNDVLWRLCCLVQGTALDIANSPAGGESNGDCYIVGGSPSGDFSTFSANDVAIRIGGGWVNLTPGEGWSFWIQDTNETYYYNGSSWASSGGSQGLTIPSSDHTSTGNSTSSINAGESVTIMELVYLKSDGKWWRADANAESTSVGLLAISLESKSADQAMDVAMTGSFVRDDSWSWTPGAMLYVDTTTGAITAVQPSGSGDVIRVVGFAATADVIFFNPSPDYITHA